MTSSADLWQATRRTWADASPLEPAEAAPAPGDVVVLGRLAAFHVEWAVLASEPPNRLLVVAADGQPLVGSADVEVPASDRGGPLVLRCRFGGWVDAGAFASAIRTGSLDPGVVARARALVLSPRGRRERDVCALEVDDETRYRSWVRETLEPAWQTLAGESHRATADEPRDQRRKARLPVGRRRPDGRRWHRPRLLALAASMLTLVGAALFWRQHRELVEQRSIAELGQHELEELRHQHGEASDEYRRQLEAAQTDLESLETDYRGRVDDLNRRLEDARRRDVVVNPLVASLDPASTRRGRAQRLHLEPGTSHVILALDLEEPKPGQQFRAELSSRGNGRILWTGSGLRRGHLGLWIGFPAALLPPGAYVLRIFELEGGSELAAEYALEVSGAPRGDR